jgi:hypothetical protein
MKKLILSAAVCLLVCSLFVGGAPAWATVATFETNFSGAWVNNSADVFTLELSSNFSTGQEFGLYNFEEGISFGTLPLLDDTSNFNVGGTVYSIPSIFSVSDTSGKWVASLGEGKGSLDLNTGPSAEWGFYFKSAGNEYTVYDYIYVEDSNNDYYILYSPSVVDSSGNEIAVGVHDAQPIATPVPTAAVLLGSGLVGLVGFRRKILRS